VTEHQSGLEVGRRRVLHPGPLRWLRASGWMLALFIVFMLIYAGAQVIESPLSSKAGHGAGVLGVAVKESWLVSSPKPGAPAFLSGGAFGPEASLPAMVVGTSVAVVVLWMTWRRGMFVTRPDASPEAVTAG
jgi:hypothetical protein